jgi:transposase-like protein
MLGDFSLRQEKPGIKGIYPWFDGVGCLESWHRLGGRMPARYPSAVRRQVVELARAGTRVAQLAETFGMTETTIYNWINQEKIDRGEIVGQTTDQALELAAAKRRIRELETELAVSRKVNEIFLDQDLAPKASSR